jgi:hypothetical protein
MGTESKKIKKKLSDTEVWATTYNGHEIKVVNGSHTKMYIDGKEVANHESFLSTQVILRAVIPETNKVVMARVHQKAVSDVILSCDFMVGDVLKTEYGFQHKDGTTTMLTDDEVQQYVKATKEELEDPTAAIIAMMNTF